MGNLDKWDVIKLLLWSIFDAAITLLLVYLLVQAINTMK